MTVAIFTSRVILESLGITDYGTLTVIGGLAYSFGFFSSSMSNATQRYLSFGHGQGNIEKVKEYFNIISILYLISGGIILVVGGSLGFWIVSKLNIPPDKYWAGVVVYYTTLISLLVTIITSIFDSVLVAREQLDFYAYVSIIEAFLKLGVSYLIFIIPNHKLVYYSVLYLGVIILIKGLLWLYCIRRFPECHFRLVWQPNKIKGTLSFMGWNGLGTIVWVINEQGVNILLNLFFGPIVNAARGIANQVNAALNNFVSNFFLALNPQIIKNYAAGDYKRCIDMMYRASVFSFLLLWLVSLPIILRRDYILHLWLESVPEYTSIFLLWILVYSLINVLTRPQWTVIQAVGNLKHYILNGCITMLGAIPIGYILFRYGFVPQSILIVLVVLRSIYVIISIYTIRKFISFTRKEYVKDVVIPILSVIIPSSLILYILNELLPINFIGLILLVLVNFIVTVIIGIVVIPKSYRSQIFTMVKKRFI